MRRFSFFIIFFLLSIAIASDAITVTLTRNFTADKYPEGGHPVDKTHFNKFSFSLNDLGLDASKYYDIDVRLTSTKYKGYAANFGTTTSSDLKFHVDDNTGWVFKTADHLQYKWTTDPNQQSVPSSITVRCYDWGANGDVTVTVREQNSNSMGYTDSARIPYDDNENGIADGWETVAALKVLLENNLLGYDPDWDEEVAPDEKNKNNGDGWTNYDEWRGIFQTQNDAAITRLDVTQKDVMVCSDTKMAAFGTGSMPPIEKHLIRTLEPYQENGTWSIVNDPWGDVFDGAKVIDVNEDTGWVNFNSTGNKRAWAIRITDGGAYNLNSKTLGHAVGGSPSQYSKIEIFTENIENYVNGVYEEKKKHYEDQVKAQYLEYAKKNPSQKKQYENAAKRYEWRLGTQARKDNAIDFVTNNTVAHEVGHCLNITSHCTRHPTCFMRAPSFVSSKYDVPYETGVMVTIFAGIKKSFSLDKEHYQDLAVTGQSGSTAHESVYDGTIPLGDIDVSELPGSLSSSNGSYTVTPGDSHTANFSTDSPYSSVKWYVKPPGDTSDRGSLVETDTGDGSATTASLSYTFATDAVGGAYVITAYVTTPDGVYEVSYTVTIPTVPSSPSIGVIGIMGDDRIYLSWRKPSDDGGAAITDYEYRYRIVGSTDEGTWTSGGMDFNETVSGLSTDTIYEIEVRAKNSVGYSDASTSVSFYTRMTKTVPSAPRSLSAVAGDGSVELSWSPPENDGNSAILRYEYRYGIGELATVENYTAWASMGSAMAKYPVSPLTNDMYHIFEVRAVNAIGNSLPSAAATATPTAPTPDPITPPGPPTPTPTPTPPTSVPKQPTGLSVVSISNGTVELSWSDPEGGGVNEYECRVDPNNDGSWNDWKSLKSSATSARLMLQNGRTYGIVVRAVNSLGSSTKSTKVTAMPVDSSVSTPSAPRNLTATAGNGQVRLSWNAPSTGSGIIDYEYRLDTNDDGSWQKWKITNSTSTSYTVTGLTNDTVYAFKVRARNAGGIGSQSEEVSATPINITVPTKPRNLTAALQSSGYVYLDWDAPSDNGGSSITDYDYIIDTHNDGSWETWWGLDSTYTDVYFLASGFTPGVTYAFKIRAVNSVGGGTASDKAVITTPNITTPSAVQYLSADAGNASVYLSWSEPTDDGYSVIRGGTLNYQYRYRQSSGTWNAWSTEQWENYVTVSSLANGTSYEFEVLATNDVGTGPVASVSATPTGAAVPGVPTYFGASSRPASVELWWDPPDYDGGSPITDYEYNYRQSGGSWKGWTSAGNANADYPEYTVTGLTNGTTYQFKVRARNVIGAGESTSVLSETPKAQKPAKPTGLSATAGSTTGSVELSWTAPNDGGSPITGYKVTYAIYENGWKQKNWTDLTSTGSTSTSYTVTGLESGELYRFRVAATNSLGDSPTSAYAQTYAP